MVNDGMRHLRRAWWISSFPALAIVVVVLAINLVGTGCVMHLTRSCGTSREQGT